MAEGALEGRRIVVTRPRERADELAENLQRLGARVLVMPLIAIEQAADVGPLDAAIAGIGRYDWIVFTSANGVQAVAARLADDEPPVGVKVAAIGSATAAAVRTLGVEPSFVPERFLGVEIAAGLEPLAGARILLPQADIADSVLTEELRTRGAIVDAISAYRTIEVERSPSELAEIRAADVVVLASGSAARVLASRGGAGDALVLAIGPKTADVAREVGLPVGLVAHEATSEGMIQALVTHFQEF